MPHSNTPLFTATDYSTRMLPVCSNCGQCRAVDYYPLDEGVTLLCRDCASSTVETCSTCGRLTRLTRHAQDGITVLCRACWYDAFFVCEGCHAIRPQDDESCGVPGHCMECAEGRRFSEDNDEDDGPIYGHNYLPDDLQWLLSAAEAKQVPPMDRTAIAALPTQWLRQCAREGCYPDKMYFGVELEVEVTGEESRTYLAGQLPSFTFAKNDGSLTHGFEVVSVPATWTWMRENEQKWNDTLNFLRRHGCRSYQTTTCGMHVHISKEPVSSFHLYKLLTLVYRNQPLFERLSRRPDGELSHWAQLSGWHNHRWTPEARDKHQDGKYRAINLSHPHTIEFRIFKGTLGQRGFWQNLEVVKSVVDFSKAEPPKLMTACEYKTFVKDHRKDFPRLSPTFMRTA
jgi:hypothetical protein